jgi:multidrug efflux pump
MSRFFIDRPVFAWVLAIIVILIGGISILTLPIAQYPEIAPPEVTITVTYPGASAQTVNDTVVRPILQQMSGLDGLEYISSSTESSGAMEIDLTFAQGTNPDTAQVQVQNKLSIADSNLPAEVTQQGVEVKKASKDFMEIVGFVSTNHSMDTHDIGDYIASNIQDQLTRITGVGDYTLFGSEYAMRISLNPGELFKYSLTVADVITAIEAQNVQISSGELGGLPAVPGQVLDATIIGPSEFQTPSQFENILLKVNTDGSQVRLRDVATVALGPADDSISSTYNNAPAAGLALKLAPGANQITTETAVAAELAVLKKTLPPGLKMVFPYDTEPVITNSLREVVQTLIIAIFLVFLVMFLFLQNIRATLIPTIAVPIVLLGTFGILSALSYGINTLTMLAMVLAVGLLIDDAIVVVENVERVMRDTGLSAREATKQSMDEISGALVGIAMVLAAVFLPMAFFSGATGVIYRQFSVTLVSAMGLSVMVALILTPALCATMLKPPKKPSGRVGLAMRFSAWFNRGFDAGNRGYGAGVKGVIRRARWSLACFGLIIVAVVFLFLRMPVGFLPDEDQGIVFGQVTTPPGSSAEVTAAADKQAVDYILKHYASSVLSVFAVTGFNFAGQSQNAGIVFLSLKDWSKRPLTSQSASAIAAAAKQYFHGNRAAQYLFILPPPVLALGNSGGFDLELEDRANLGHAGLLAARNQLLGMAAKDPLLTEVRPNGLEDAPQFELHIDREKADAFGVTNADINTTIEGALASEYVDQFTRNSRVKDVYVQGDDDARMQPADLGKWYIRNASGTMVPFDSFMTGSWTVGPQKVENYNEYTSFEILGNPAPGVSSGQAMTEISKLVAKLPHGVGYEFTGLSYEQQKAGSQTYELYAISIIVILLCLAALYESWAIPFAVMMVTPLGVLGAIIFTSLRGLDNDVYFQVGLLTTMGLSVKNAILIVEFAKANYDGGMTLIKAAEKAAHDRLRPILMTSLAFVFGTFPLAIATGAGAGARIAIGTSVVGGMISGTLLVILFVPMFFVLVLGAFKVQRLPGAAKAQPEAGLATAAGVKAH